MSATDVESLSLLQRNARLVPQIKGTASGYGEVINNYNMPIVRDAAGRYWPGEVVRVAGRGRAAGAGFYQLHRAVEFDDPHIQSAFHPVDQRVRQEASESRSVGGAVHGALQLVLGPRNDAHDAGGRARQRGALVVNRRTGSGGADARGPVRNRCAVSLRRHPRRPRLDLESV